MENDFDKLGDIPRPEMTPEQKIERLKYLQEQQIELAKEYVKAKVAESKRYYCYADDRQNKGISKKYHRYYVIDLNTKKCLRWGTIDRIRSLFTSRDIKSSDILFDDKSLANQLDLKQ